MNLFSNILMVCLVIISVQTSCNSNTKKGGANNKDQVITSILLSPADFESKLASIPDAQLVDVRTPGEFNEGYIKGAININYQGDTFEDAIAKLDKKKPTFVYCRSGGRSAESCSYMAKIGFKTLYELDGGITRWLNDNKPTELKQK